MIPPQLIGAIVGGAGGGLKGILFDRPRLQRQAAYEEAKMRYGYPLGIHGERVEVPGVLEAGFGGALQGAMGGAGIGQSFGQMQQDQNVYNAYLDKMKTETDLMKARLPQNPASATMQMQDTNMATPPATKSTMTAPGVVPGRVQELTPEQYQYAQYQNALSNQNSPYARILQGMA